MKNSDTSYYFIETLILSLGFFTLYMFPFAGYTQVIAMGVLVVAYAVMGIIHHTLDHDIHTKIVLEYILIGSLVFALFLFLRSGTV
jgi:hypothetical protein